MFIFLFEVLLDVTLILLTFATALGLITVLVRLGKIISNALRQ